MQQPDDGDGGGAKYCHRPKSGGSETRSWMTPVPGDSPRTPAWHIDAARGPSTPSFEQLVGPDEQGHLDAERLRAQSDGPGRRAAEHRDELAAAAHSITSLARCCRNRHCDLGAIKKPPG